MKTADDTTDGPEPICYVTESLPDAEAIAGTLDGRIEVREKHVKVDGRRKPTVKREFIVRSDASGWPESDFFDDRIST